MNKSLKNILKAILLIGALPMLIFLYGLFYRAVSESHGESEISEYENKFYQKIVKKCIIVYYFVIATLLIWNNL